MMTNKTIEKINKVAGYFVLIALIIGVVLSQALIIRLLDNRLLVCTF